MATVCPVCGKDDAIQKVSAVVVSGRSTGTFAGPSGGLAYVGGKWGVAGGYTTLSGETVSHLARELKGPEKPREKGGLGCLLWGLWFYPGTAFIGGFGAMVGAVVAPNSPETQVLAGALALIGSLFLMFHWHNKRISENRATYQIQLKAWEVATEAWSRLYYCFRDDVIFDPEKGEHRPPVQLKELLDLGPS